MPYITFHPTPGKAYLSIRSGSAEVGQIRYTRSQPEGQEKNIRVYENAVAQTVNPSPLESLEEAKTFAIRYFLRILGEPKPTPRPARARLQTRKEYQY